MLLRIRVLPAAIAGLCWLVVAQAAPVDLSIPAQPADAALKAWLDATKSDLLFDFTALHEQTSHEVSGRLEPEDALRRLLEGTGFTFRKSGPEKFVIVRAAPLAGSIRGRVITSAGTAAVAVRLVLLPTRQSAVTDEAGTYEFRDVTPGSYRVTGTSEGFDTLQFAAGRVDAGRTLELAAQTIRRANEATQLERVVVEGRNVLPGPADRDNIAVPARSSTGNLDMARTQDDALPYTIYDRTRILRSGVVNLNEFLQRELLDGSAATVPPEQRPGSDSGEANMPPGNISVGSTNLRLRGYGMDETVILVNGRRLPEILTSGREAAPPPPDVNFIPLNLVERVDVLPVSASAIYSGSAVGGVINIVLRPQVNQTEITTTYINAFHGLHSFDAPQSTVSLQHGESFLDGKLQVRLSASLTQSTPPTESELGYIRANLNLNPSTSDALYRATPNIRSATGQSLSGPGSPSVTSVPPGAAGSGGLAAFAGRQGVRSLDLFDSPGGYATSPASVDEPYGRRQRGESFYFSAGLEPFPWLQLGVDATRSRSVINRGYNVFTADLTLRAGAANNPFGQDVLVSLNETAPRLGQDYNEARLDFSSVVAGALVSLPGDWRVSVDAQYGHNITRYRGLAGADADRWQKLVDDGLYQPLRDTQVQGPPGEFYDRALIFYGGKGTFVKIGDYRTLDSALRITNQSLILPAGRASVTVGGDYRRSQLDPFSDGREYGDGTSAGTPTSWTGRTLQRVSVFGEVQAPLLPSRWRPDWLKRVEVDLASRYVVADSAQESNMAPTAGVRIDLADGLSVRGSVATSNRLPTPFMSRKGAVAPVLVGGGVGDVSTVSVSDPLRGEQNDGVISSDAPNPNLRPESSVTRTIGLMFQRGRDHRIRASVDWVETRKSGELTHLEPQSVVYLESQLPGRVIRAPLLPGDGKPAGKITNVFTGNFNLAWRESQNWNTSLEYSWDKFLGGTLEIRTQWIYFPRYDVQFLPNDPTVDELRHPDVFGGEQLRQRANFGAGWSRPDFGFGLDGHYYHSRVLQATEQVLQGADRIAGLWQYDAYLQGDVGRWLPFVGSRLRLRGQLRVNNVLGGRPPRYAAESSGAGVQSYGDWRGRTLSLSLTATF